MEQSSEARDQVDLVHWDTARRLLRIQIFGAEGALGRELALELLKSGHPASGLALFGRHRQDFSWGGKTLSVVPVSGHLPEADLAFLCTNPRFASQLLPILSSRGVRAIDLTGASRTDAAVPFLLPGVNGAEVGAFTEVVALPNRTAGLIARALSPLERNFGLQGVDCVALLSAATQGAEGILAVRDELARGAAGCDKPPHERRVSNLLPCPSGPVDSDEALVVDGKRLGGSPHEEVLIEDTRRLLDRPDLPLDLTALRTDVERSDALVLKAHLRAPATPDQARQLYRASPGILVDDSAAGPIPLACAGSGALHVGRIRAGSFGVRSLCFFAVGDQLRAGAALAALRVAAQMPPGG